jgi:hypothetical protein
MMKAEKISGRTLNVLTSALSRYTPLEILVLKGCGRQTFHEIVGLMQSNGSWQEYDAKGIPIHRGTHR